MSLILPRAFGGQLNRAGIPRIDWSHPLARGLVCCYLPGVAQGTNLTGFGANLSGNTSPLGPVTTPEGAGRKFTGSNSGMYSTTAAPVLFGATPAAPVSMFWRGSAFGAPINDSADFVGITWDNAGGFPNRLAGIYSNFGSGAIFMQNSSSSATGFTNSPPANGVLFDVAGTFPPAGSTAIGYFNGVPDGATIGGNSSSAAATATITLGTFPSFNRASNTYTLCGYIWNRILSATEVFALHDDPYCFLLYPEDDLFDTLIGIPAAAPVGGNPIQLLSKFTSSGQYKRAGIPRIDWSHPLTSGLKIYCYNDSATFIDLINGKQATTRSGGLANTAVAKTNAFGNGISFVAATGDSSAATPAYPAATNAAATLPYSMACGTVINGTAGQGSAVVVGTYDLANNPGPGNRNDLVTFRRGSSSSGMSFAWFKGQSNANFNTAETDGLFQSWVMVATSSSTATLYANGLLDSSVTGITNPTTVSSAANGGVSYNNTRGDPSQNQDSGCNTFVPFFACWNRALTASEAQLLHQDPYCFLLYQEDDLFNTLTGGAGGPAVTSAVGNAAGIGAASADSTGTITGIPLAPTLIKSGRVMMRGPKNRFGGAMLASPLPAGITIASGTGVAAGTGAATAVGTGINTANGIAAGIGVANAVGAALATAQAVAAGTGAASAVGVELATAQAVAAGTGAASAVGVSFAIAQAVAAGTGSASAQVGLQGSSAGTGAASAVGIGVNSANGVAAGTGAASAVGTGINSANGVAAGTGAATAVGASVASSPGLAAGIGSAAAASGALSQGVAAGTGAATAVGASTAVSQGASAGLGSLQAKSQSIGVASGIGAAGAQAAEQGLAAGTGAVNAVGLSTAVAQGVAAGIGGVTALSGSASKGVAAGIGSAAAVGTGINTAVGVAAGTSSSTATGASLFSGQGVAAGTGLLQAKSQSIGAAAGTVTVNAVGFSQAVAQGVSAGIGGASATSGAASQGVSAGTGSAAAIGSGINFAAGVSAGTGVASAAGTGINTAVGASAGIGSAITVGSSLAVSQGSAAGAGNVFATSGVFLVGNAAGIGAVNAVGFSVARSNGIAAGLGSVSATATVTVSAKGLASGLGSASTAGGTVFTGVGNSAGIGHVTAISLAYATGVSSSVSNVVGIGKALFTATGQSSGIGTATAVGFFTVPFDLIKTYKLTGQADPPLESVGQKTKIQLVGQSMTNPDWDAQL